MGLLVVPFVLIPVLEVVVFILVGSRIGLGPLILSIIITGIIGAYVASRQGGSTWRRAQDRMASGQLPGKELAHGVMILVGGVLLLTPGFITDIVGFLLMVPAVREGVRRFTARRMMGKFAVIDIEGR